MAKARDMRSALGASLKAEETRVAERKLDRFALAEAVLGSSEVEENVAPEKANADSQPTVIRDSFSFPPDDYALLRLLRERGLKAGIHVNKSELVRAGLQVLRTLSERDFVAAVERLERVKTGRPSDR